MTEFVRRYGPWAVVAGASEGIGASFSQKLAARGMNLVLVARRAAPLEDLAADLRQAHGVEVRVEPMDLGSPDLVAAMNAATEALDVGLVIYNAAYSPIGTFLDGNVEDHLKAVDVNVRGPLMMSHYFGRRLVQRGNGGIILMSSMSGFQGTAMVANYAATKAYDMILAEGLWYELRRHGVDVLACVAGATLTPNYESSTDRIPSGGLAKPMRPEDVTEQALRDLGHRPEGVSGRRNRLASELLRRLLPRTAAIAMVSKETERMYR
ncbi:MAG: SDR family NAD(P)-dependent oxidoreductase [Polyangiales bacterium]